MSTAILFALGLITLAIARGLTRQRLREEAWVGRAVRAEGTIHMATEYFDLSLRQYVQYGPGDETPPGKIVFRARDGHEYAIPAPPASVEGGKARVLYDPDSPSTATLDRPAPGQWREVVVRSIGGLLLTAALIDFWLGARP
jgi:hypothetical protein